MAPRHPPTGPGAAPPCLARKALSEPRPSAAQPPLPLVSVMPLCLPDAWTLARHLSLTQDGIGGPRGCRESFPSPGPRPSGSFAVAANMISAWRPCQTPPQVLSTPSPTPSTGEVLRSPRPPVRERSRRRRSQCHSGKSRCALRSVFLQSLLFL